MKKLLLTIMMLFISTNALAHDGESAYDRVIKSGKLRCAYGVWEPAVMKDPNTGEMSGIIVEFMEHVGELLNIEVEYMLEVSWDSIPTALITGKADAHCAGVFATGARARTMAFTDPIFFSPTVAFSRIDDERFDYNLERINQDDITIGVSDDSIITEIYKQDFPNAKSYELPQLVQPEEVLLAIHTKKADVSFNSPARLHTYNKNNPGQIKVIPTKKPLRVFANTISMSPGETELQNMLNTAINQLIDSGVVDKLLKKYGEKYPTDFLLPVERPYRWDH